MPRKTHSSVDFRNLHIITFFLEDSHSSFSVASHFGLLSEVVYKRGGVFGRVLKLLRLQSSVPDDRRRQKLLRLLRHGAANLCHPLVRPHQDWVLRVWSPSTSVQQRLCLFSSTFTVSNLLQISVPRISQYSRTCPPFRPRGVKYRDMIVPCSLLPPSPRSGPCRGGLIVEVSVTIRKIGAGAPPAAPLPASKRVPIITGICLTFVLLEVTSPPEYEDTEDEQGSDEEDGDDDAEDGPGAALRSFATISFHGQTELLFDSSVTQLSLASIHASVCRCHFFH
jgi:hypothetical protein